VSQRTSNDVDRRGGRRAEILDAATELFHARGFAGVTVDQLAASLGMSGPALYRHFRGKQDLLRAVVDDAVTRLEAAILGRDTADRFVSELSRVWSDPSHLGSIIEREIVHLEESERVAFAARIDRVFDTIADAIDDDDTDRRAAAFLARAMVAVASSSSFARIDEAGSSGEDAIGRSLRVLAFGGGLTPADLVDPVGRVRVPVRDWLPREEAILAALPGITFERGGIGAVTLEAVGSSAGISGPSVYNYFDSKAALWTTWLARVSNWSISSLQQSLAYSEGPHEVMRRALEGYAEMTRRVPAFAMPVDPSDPRLSEVTRSEIEEFSADYLGLWQVCAQTARPELDAHEAEALLLASHAVINRARTLSPVSAIPSDAALSRLGLAVFSA